MENKEVQGENTTHKDEDDDKRMTLYRGLGLPEGAIEGYRDKAKLGDVFEFTGFTSTSCEKEQAMKFTYQYGHLKRESGQVPVLLVMDVEHFGGKFKAFLYDSRCSAFPEEKEYLLGLTHWKTTRVSEETLEYKKNRFEGWVIYLE